jgi:hypothetical protein
VEVAADDSSFHTFLELADGSLMLEDAKTAVATVDPLSRFGSSAFGPVRIRAISADGTTGDWQPLGTLVRLPGFTELRCPRAVSKPCMLSGNNLFLADSIASTPDFGNSADVPPEFTGTQLAVPHPVNGILYLKLRDDPSTVQTLTLSVVPITLPAEAAAIKSQPAGPMPAPAQPSTPTEAPSEPSTAPATPPVAPQASVSSSLAAQPASVSGGSKYSK